MRGGAGRGGHGQRRQQLSNEIRANLVDHELREASRIDAFLFCNFLFQFTVLSIFLFTPT